MKQKIILQTDRLFLREVVEDDISELMKLFSDPIAMQFFLGIKDEVETRDWIRDTLYRYEKDGFSFYICVNKKTLDVVGYCGLLLQEDVDGKDEVEIGYGLIRKYWHHGFATEAAIGCKKYGFGELKLEKLISLIRPENVPSIRVANRNGMKWERDIVRWNYVHGIYAITKNEYLQSEKSN
jgi:RimJ/RimL family protein N-acetyltransferase